jgi:hypothetical protein
MAIGFFGARWRQITTCHAIIHEIRSSRTRAPKLTRRESYRSQLHSFLRRIMYIRIVFRPPFRGLLRSTQALKASPSLAPTTLMPKAGHSQPVKDSGDKNGYQSDPWIVEGEAAVWECPRHLLRKLAQIVTYGFVTNPAGGPEVGGVLYGAKAGNVVRMMDCRPIACDHAEGPAFVLSPKEVADVDQMLQAGALGTSKGVIPVGWYHTTYRELRMMPESARLHERLFPESWQAALVLRRERDKPVTVGLFPKGDVALANEATPLATTMASAAPSLVTAPIPPLVVAVENEDSLELVANGIRERAGLALVASPLERLLSYVHASLREETLAIAVLREAPRNCDDFYDAVWTGLRGRGENYRQDVTGAWLSQLWSRARQGATTLLAIDHAGQLNDNVLDELCALDELRSSCGALVQILLLCGQPTELNALAARVRRRQSLRSYEDSEGAFEPRSLDLRIRKLSNGRHSIL